MKNKYTVIVEEGEDGYLISDVVELPGCHTQAKTIKELLERTREAIQGYLELKDNLEINSKFIEVKQIEV